MVTRPESAADPLAVRLAEMGAEVVVQPAVRITDPDDWRPVDAVLADLAQFDWMVFSSGNGVRRLIERWTALGLDRRLLERIKMAAIGPGTAEQLVKLGLHADLIPENFRAESLAELLIQAAGTDGRFLLVRASRGREVLVERLEAAGKSVRQIVVYASRDVDEPEPAVAQLLESGQIDWVTVTSSAIARSVVRLFGELLRKSRLASISPITTETLRNLGFEPAVEATQYTMHGLADAIAQS